MALWLAFEADGTNHRDVLLTLGDSALAADSYYFGIDQAVDGADHSPARVRRSMAAMLDEWIDLVTGLGVGGRTFLPYEFDDEWLGCVQVDRVAADAVRLRVGVAAVNGYAVYPSEVKGTVVTISALESVRDEPDVECTVQALIGDIRRSRAALFASEQ